MTLIFSLQTLHINVQKNVGVSYGGKALCTLIRVTVRTDRQYA